MAASSRARLRSLDYWVLRGATIEEALHLEGLRSAWDRGVAFLVHGTVVRRYWDDFSLHRWVRARRIGTPRAAALELGLQLPSGGTACDGRVRCEFTPPVTTSAESVLPFVPDASIQWIYFDSIDARLRFVLRDRAQGSETTFERNMALRLERSEPRRLVLRGSERSGREMRLDGLVVELVFVDAEEVPLSDRLLVQRALGSRATG
ncbi:MAG: hypothetical protein HOW73_46140 [Polyangiaceae bacterium]|nr:hypothetical protein [Polyangiaceae bacterium]